MPQITTYSFSDIFFQINAPAGLYPSFSINGQGIGEISIAWAQDNSLHDLAADGSVMISKVLGSNGTINFSIQQTSTLHNYMKGLFANLYNAPSINWAAVGMTITSNFLNSQFDNIHLTGCSIVKRADQPYHQQGQMVTWNWMFADGQTQGTSLPSIILNNI